MMKNIFLNIIILTSLLVLQSCKSKELPQTPFFQLMSGEENSPDRDAAAGQLLLDAIRLEMVEGNIGDAINQLNGCLSINPTNTAALYRLARLYMVSGRIEEGLSYAEKASMLSPENKWFRLLLIEFYEKTTQYTKAINEFETLIESDPDELGYDVAVSRLYLMSKKPSKAITTLNRIEAKTGISEPVSIQKKNIYQSMGKLNKAVDEVEKLSLAFPENTDYMRLLAEMYRLANNDQKVFEVYKKIAEVNPMDGMAQLILADYYSRWNMQEKALEKAKTAFSNPDLDIQSKIRYMILNYVEKEIVIQNKSEILDLIDIIAWIHPNDLRVYAFRADIYTLLSEHEKALEDYKKALEGEKKNPLLWEKVIVSEMDASRFESAILYTSEALDFFPSSPQFYLYIGLSYNRIRDFNKSVEYLLSGLNYVISNEPLKFQFYVNLGESYNSMKIHDKSDHYFEMALQIDSLDAGLLNNYAYYLSLRKEKLDKAETLSLKSLKINPESPAYLDTYGWILYQQGKYNEAENFIRKALDKKPWDAEVLEHYGDALFRNGQTEEAVKYWIRAKEKGSTSPFIEKKINDRNLYE